MKTVLIHTKKNTESMAIAVMLADFIKQAEMRVIFDNDPDQVYHADFAVSVGGDGSLLKILRAIGFADIPVLGVNTGHLGFFAELSPDKINIIPDLIKSENYVIQKHRTIKTIVNTEDGTFELLPSLNDVMVRYWYDSMIHLKLYIGNDFIENFSGDGVLVASSAGSTAYNYSLGGSIVDPRLDLLQLTPVAPVNNRAYRSLTSSIMLPADKEIIIQPENIPGDAMIIIDGKEKSYNSIRDIRISLSEKTVSIVRLQEYSFWNKVSSKFL